MNDPHKLAKSIKGPVPFWFINGPMTRDDVSRDLDMMRSRGISEVVVHPRFGLNVPYLSDQWFEIAAWCIEEAKAREMFIWLYDELNWPSGTAGMTVQNMDPSYMSKYLSVDMMRASDVDLLTYEPGQFLVGARLQGGKVTKTRTLETIDAIRGLDRNWQVFNCRIKRDKYYIDTTNREAVDCFKRLTYDHYYSRFGSEFGKTIRAIFTDEPSIYWVSIGYDDTNLPYTERLFQDFQERYGYSAVPNIPYLFYPGGAAAEFRAHFWRLVADLFNTNYHGNLGSWCREHGVLYTGHNNNEEPLRYQIRYQGDMFGTMKTMDIPGVDHLDKTTLGNPLNSIIGHKIASSSAHFAGKPRVMSESFGLTNWDATFTTLKKVVDWQFAQGINLLVPHALFHSIAGPLKRESPPSFFLQSPLWEDFGHFSEYVDRLTEMLTGSRHLSKILVLYPLSGLFSAYQTDRKTPEFEFIDNFLGSLCLELMKKHLDYELIDSQTLDSAEVAQGEIKIGDESYTILLVPATPYLHTEEAGTIERIARAGVLTYFFHRSVEPSAGNQPRSAAGINFEPTERLGGFVERLREGVADSFRLFGADSDQIVVLRREMGRRQVAFLVNRTDEERRVTVRFGDSSGTVTLMRTDDGQERRLTLTDDRSAELHFAPNQSIFLILGDTQAIGEEEPSGESREFRIEKLDLRPVRNVASIYHFRYSGEGDRAETDVRQSPICYPVNWHPDPPDYSQFAGEYTTTFELNTEPEGIQFVLDKDFEAYGIYVNGQEVKPQPGRTWLVDTADICADIGQLLKRGENEIKILADSRLSEPVRLAGDFDVLLEGSRVKVEPAGSRRTRFAPEEALPHYSGTLTYFGDFKLDALPARVRLDLGDVRDAAAVTINGRDAGKRLWPPYELDVTDFLREGENEIEIAVRNTPANLIMGEPRPLGLRRPPILRIWDSG